VTRNEITGGHIEVRSFQWVPEFEDEAGPGPMRPLVVVERRNDMEHDERGTWWRVTLAPDMEHVLGDLFGDYQRDRWVENFVGTRQQASGMAEALGWALTTLLNDRSRAARRAHETLRNVYIKSQEIR
jgi:hypothetical protein